MDLRFRTGLALLALSAATPAVAAAKADLAKWRATAARVSIARDEWGIAHVRAHRDADVVFGAIYAQAEDDFARIEANYLAALGRTAEAKGEGAIWQDLRQRLYIDPDTLKAEYRASPPWLKALMLGWANGLNYYLATHPAVRPQVIRRFEPWMALSFTEGSIGGDIERISESDIAGFYGRTAVARSDVETGRRPEEPRGSNGIAIAPANTVGGHALLLINPHTSFYFRSEMQLTSDEGLDAYGAATWGQFFIYQGFNAHAGWMHTSTTADVVDEFAETIVRQDGRLSYRYGDTLRPVTTRPIAIAFRRADGSIGRRSFTGYFTHHGPITGAAGGKWIATALMNRPVAALEQSWLRTKAHDLAGYLRVAELQANSSNNTLFADRRGEIAYLHPQFVPRRDDRFDYTRPVDGADPATDWHGVTPLVALPRAINPPTGWAMNTNNGPWGAAGADSPKRAAFPRYMDGTGENARGVHATMLLTDRRDFTPERLMAAAFDPYLPAFATLIPRLAAAYDALPAKDPRRAALAEPIALLKGWDDRWSATSTATTLAVFWGDALWRDVGEFARAERVSVPDYIATKVPAADQLAALARAVATLRAGFGDWRVAWGAVNRFQRLDDRIDPHFDDAAPSVPVPFTSAQWGSLASFGAHAYPGTHRYYGTSGNSFVAVVEFGPKLRAWAVMAGGQSGDPRSPHFRDQVERYAGGQLRPVHFTAAEVATHAVRRYHPGE